MSMSNFTETDKRGHGTYNKRIINPVETLDGSKDVISYISHDLESFNYDNRIITSVEVNVNYLNTDQTNHSTIPADYDEIRTQLGRNLLMLEDSRISVNGDEIVWMDSNETIRDKLIHYLDVVCDQGILTPDKYHRVDTTIKSIYNILVISRKDVSELDVNKILKEMYLDYEVKRFLPTAACPEDYYRVIKYHRTAKSDANINTDSARSKIDQFIKKWFGNNGRIYDKDRDEFYNEFSSLYESLTGSHTETRDEGGVLVPIRRKKVMSMKPLMNYSDINKILKQYGLNYTITYKQEVVKDESGMKRRNALSITTK